MWDSNRRYVLSDAATATAPGTSTSGDIASIVTALAPVATGVIAQMDQQKLFDYNLQLIAAGKPPLTADQIVAMQSSFTPQLNVGLGTDTAALAKDALIGAGLLLSAFLVVRMIQRG